MNSQEMLVLFIGVLLASMLVITTLYSVVQKGTNTASNVYTDVRSTTTKDFQVIEISRGSTETNIYVQGVAGVLNPENVMVIINGASYTPSVSLIRDTQDANLINPGDVALIRVPRGTTTTDCIRLGIDGVYTTLGAC